MDYGRIVTATVMKEGAFKATTTAAVGVEDAAAAAEVVAAPVMTDILVGLPSMHSLLH